MGVDRGCSGEDESPRGKSAEGAFLEVISTSSSLLYLSLASLLPLFLSPSVSCPNPLSCSLSCFDIVELRDDRVALPQEPVGLTARMNY